MRPSHFFLLALVFLASSCRDFTGHRVRGNGHIKSETRTAGSFTNIEVHGAIDVRLRQDSVSSIKVEAEDNLLEFIQIGTDGNTLVIETEDGYNLRPRRDMVVYVSNPSFTRVSVSGACNVSSENRISNNGPLSFSLTGASEIDMDISSVKVDVDATGASKVRLKGETKDLILEGSGATEFRCFDLLSENTYVKLTGAGDAEVFASVKLEARTSGAADVHYKGNAAVTKDVSGAGSVVRSN